ncbi:MAG: toxin-antitoxin system YwqK family antitoxin [Chlamydiae bacterium]|nr:toxin-antitoxin system YwqK family antitoxin [Chlamydiota bacterium]
MKIRRLSIPVIAFSFIFSGCGNRADDDVVAERFIHKYGYAVSKEEWESKTYPGQVITTLRNGVTITATYENGILHGPCTHTYSNSQTVQNFYLYNQGNLVKEISYDLRGMPMREKIQLSPSRYSLTMWYSDGTPASVEDYAGEELVEGEYFTLNNETESRIEKGCGMRMIRDELGILVAKDTFENGYMSKRETFYPGGTPESINFYSMNKLHGEKKIFAPGGEPLAIEEWTDGLLHGKAAYFSNGAKQMEISYLYGLKNGLETHYIDGKTVSKEILWENDKKHGSSTFYIDGLAKTEWFYAGQRVSKKKFDELDELDQMISKLSSDLNQGIAR